ncbi:MAG: hypothetical protein ACRDD1_20225 [Planctomycetia bacterium]
MAVSISARVIFPRPKALAADPPPVARRRVREQFVEYCLRLEPILQQTDFSIKLPFVQLLRVDVEGPADRLADLESLIRRGAIGEVDRLATQGEWQGLATDE